MSKVIQRLLVGLSEHTGPADSAKRDVFPRGHSTVTTEGHLTVTYVDEAGEASRVFILAPGTHRVFCPGRVHVLVDCLDDVKWSVTWPRRWCPSDPTRVEVPLIRPLSQQEEIKEYVAMLVEKAIKAQPGKQQRVEVDDDMSFEDDEEFSLDAPLSIHQLDFMIKELAQAKKATAQPASQSSGPAPAGPVSQSPPAAPAATEASKPQGPEAS